MRVRHRADGQRMSEPAAAAINSSRAADDMLGSLI